MKKRIRIFGSILLILIILIILSSIIFSRLNHKNLLFSIQAASSIECSNPILKVYDDNTYEFQNQKGVYSYDVKKIVENASNYEAKCLSFILTTNAGERILLCYNNVELLEFLKEIDINLDTWC